MQNFIYVIVQDHPHIHGEHLIKKKLIGFGNGSPPYTWGALNGIRFCSVRVGITPIYMGSTFLLSFIDLGLWDHPHIHGEHSRYPRLLALPQGSPPYTWGARILDFAGNSGVRITPIYMGSTLKDPCNQAIFKSSKTLFQSVWS